MDNGDDEGNIPGSAEYCRKEGWEKAKEGALVTLVRDIVHFYHSGNHLTWEETQQNSKIQYYIRQALDKYCRYFARKMYDNLLNNTDENGNLQAKPSQLTNFVDNCEAKCKLNGDFNPLQQTTQKQLNKDTFSALQMVMNMYDPIYLNSQPEGGSGFLDIHPNFLTMEQKALFTTFPLNHISKIKYGIDNYWVKGGNTGMFQTFTRMGQRINEYLNTKIAQASVTQAVEPANDCQQFKFLDGTYDVATCHAEKFNYNYPNYPANRHGEKSLRKIATDPVKCNGNSRMYTCDCAPPAMIQVDGATTIEDKWKIYQDMINNLTTVYTSPEGLKTQRQDWVKFYKQLKEYLMCKMLKRIEAVQKYWMWKLSELFNNSPAINERSRAVVMLRKEMAEKYCREFCNATLLDQKYIKNTGADQIWKLKEERCFFSCMQPQPRCHDTERCLKTDFIMEKDQTIDGIVPMKYAEISAQPPCKADTHKVWKDCNLYKNETSNIKQNFKDLKEKCTLRGRYNLFSLERNDEAAFTWCKANVKKGGSVCKTNGKICNLWNKAWCNETNSQCVENETDATTDSLYSLSKFISFNSPLISIKCFEPKWFDNGTLYNSWTTDCMNRFLYSREQRPQQLW